MKKGRLMEKEMLNQADNHMVALDAYSDYLLVLTDAHLRNGYSG